MTVQDGFGRGSGVFRRKPIEQISDEKTALTRTLGLWQLTAIGIGGIIGAGIFSLAGAVANKTAGPAVLISFLVAGIASAAAAFSYAEFAGLIPRAGSAYTYGYAVLGEIVGWFIGWDLLLEYTAIVAVVAIGISGYFNELLNLLGLDLPVWMLGAPGTETGDVAAGSYKVNLFAVLLCLLIAFVLGSVAPFYWSFLVASHDDATFTADAPLLPGGNFFVNAGRVLDTIPFWKALGNTFFYALVSVPLGLAIGWFKQVADVLNPLLEMFRNTAALALLPVFLLLLGIGSLVVGSGAVPVGLVALVPGLAMLGTGFGLLNAPLLARLTHGIPGPRQPVAVGIYNLTFFLGGAVGAAGGPSDGAPASAAVSVHVSGTVAERLIAGSRQSPSG